MKDATSCAAMPSPCSTSPTMVSDSSLRGEQTVSARFPVRFPVAATFYTVKASAYVSDGMKGAGPTREKPTMMSRQPMMVATLGAMKRSHSMPQQGAVSAYVPPLMTNMRPSTTADSWNCRRGPD